MIVPRCRGDDFVHPYAADAPEIHDQRDRQGTPLARSSRQGGARCQVLPREGPPMITLRPAYLHSRLSTLLPDRLADEFAVPKLPRWWVPRFVVAAVRDAHVVYHPSPGTDWPVREHLRDSAGY